MREQVEIYFNHIQGVPFHGHPKGDKSVEIEKFQMQRHIFKAAWEDKSRDIVFILVLVVVTGLKKDLKIFN